MDFDKLDLEVTEEASDGLGLPSHVVVDENGWYFLL
jgi:hypothetical protein